MTYEEAINMIIDSCVPWSKEFYALCKYALKKQVPLVPNLIGDGYADGEMVYDEWECLSCGAIYEIDEKYRYCPCCGQRILWEAEE